MLFQEKQNLRSIYQRKSELDQKKEQLETQLRELAQALQNVTCTLQYDQDSQGDVECGCSRAWGCV